MPDRLRAAEAQLLHQVIAKWQPQAMQLLNVVGVVPLTVEQREMLRGVISLEFAEAGVGEDDEPNSYGLRLENLIDVLGYL